MFGVWEIVISSPCLRTGGASGGGLCSSPMFSPLICTRTALIPSLLSFAMSLYGVPEASNARRTCSPRPGIEGPVHLEAISVYGPLYMLQRKREGHIKVSNNDGAQP